MSRKVNEKKKMLVSDELFEKEEEFMDSYEEIEFPILESTGKI